MTAHAVEVHGLDKMFGAIEVLRDVSLTVPRGQVVALLGHNGAGKTTLIRILSSLERPDRGRVRVAGHDVVREPAKVRAAISLVGQFSAVDELLTGRQNLVMLARLNGLEPAAASRRAQELLEDLGLLRAADRRAATYSGGMRRRLDLAAALVTRPQVLFLDEPTTGVDPTTRGQLWGVVRDLTDAGVAVLLTTQYLEEADALADHVVVLDRGTVVAAGSAAQVAAVAGGMRLFVALADPADTHRARLLLGHLAATVGSDPRRGTLTLAPDNPLTAIGLASEALERCGVQIRSLSVRQPSLDEAFAHLAGPLAATGS